MADLIARMATSQHLTTRLEAIGDGVLTRRPRGISRDFRQWCFTARATRNRIRRARAVFGERILRVTVLLAEMHATIEGAVAGVRAAETTDPFLVRSIVLDLLAIKFLILGATQHLCVHLSTVTMRVDLDLTCTT